MLIELQAFLRVVTETHGFANVQRTAIRFLLSHEDLDERGLSGTVVAHNTHLFVTGKDVGEVIENLQIAEALVEVVGFEYLGTDIGSFYIELHLAVIEPLLSYLFELVEGFFAIACLVSTSLRHTAHPLQFGAIEVVGTFYLHIGGIDAFLTLLQIVAIITLIGINLLVVNLVNFGAHTVQEIAVVRYHEQTQGSTAEVSFQPFGHFEVEVVGRLV